MDLASWFAIGALCASGAMSPGPSLAVVLKNTVAGGPGQGIATGLGHGLGVGLYALGAVAGFSALVKASPWVERGISVAGAIFLIFLGVQALRSSGSSEAVEPTGRGFWEGFLTAFLNPKIALFFLALLSAFIPEGSSLVTRVEVAVLAMTIDTLWYVLAAAVFAGLGLASWLARHRRWVDGISGVAFVIIGLVVLVR